jgi:hypothetical protein
MLFSIKSLVDVRAWVDSPGNLAAAMAALQGVFRV